MNKPYVVGFPGREKACILVCCHHIAVFFLLIMTSVLTSANKRFTQKLKFWYIPSL